MHLCYKRTLLRQTRRGKGTYRHKTHTYSYLSPYGRWVPMKRLYKQNSIPTSPHKHACTRVRTYTRTGTHAHLSEAKLLCLAGAVGRLCKITLEDIILTLHCVISGRRDVDSATEEQRAGQSLGGNEVVDLCNTFVYAETV